MNQIILCFLPVIIIVVVAALQLYSSPLPCFCAVFFLIAAGILFHFSIKKTIANKKDKKPQCVYSVPTTDVCEPILQSKQGVFFLDDSGKPLPTEALASWKRVIEAEFNYDLSDASRDVLKTYAWINMELSKRARWEEHDEASKNEEVNGK